MRLAIAAPTADVDNVTDVSIANAPAARLAVGVALRTGVFAGGIAP
jgi:hypothetical protein